EAEDHEADRQRDELPLARMAPLLAVGQQIDSDHSKPRSASPQAIISMGASCASCRGRIRSEIAMLANGLAMSVATPARFATSSSIPGSSAQPPVSTIWSIWLYDVEVKKNCRARVTSSARVSMNGCRTSAS